MKFNVIEIDKNKFKPVKIEITLESIEDVGVLWGKLQGSKAQYDAALDNSVVINKRFRDFIKKCLFKDTFDLWEILNEILKKYGYNYEIITKEKSNDDGLV
jgi:hypothetical protein